jgi:hypothetical protein
MLNFTGKDEVPSVPKRRGAIIGDWFGLNTATASTPVSSPQTQEEIEWELEQEEAQRHRQEQARFDAEPLLVKRLRKAFAMADNVMTLLKDIYKGERFGRYLQDPAYEEMLSAEIGSNEEQKQSLELVKRSEGLQLPVQVTSVFAVLQPFTKKLEYLSNHWHQVLRHYAAVDGDDYSFSLQPLAKLYYFYQAINGLVSLGYGFNQNMKRPDEEIVNDLARYQVDIENFITVLETFCARTIVLYKILDGVKTHLEDIARIRRELNGVFIDNIKMTVTDYEEEEVEEPLSAELLAEIVAEATVLAEEAAAMIFELSSYDMRLENLESEEKIDSEEYKQVRKIRAELEKKYNATQSRQNEIKKKYRDQKKIYDEEIEELRTKRAAAKQTKQEHDEVRVKFESDMAQQAVEDRKEAYGKLIEFFVVYTQRPDGIELLSLSEPVQVGLSDVSVTMLQLWIADQGEDLSKKVCKWLTELIKLHVRDLRMSLSISNENIEIKLQDDSNTMLEFLSIMMNGPVRGSLLTSPSAKAPSEQISAAYLSTLQQSFMKDVSENKVRINKLLSLIRESKAEYSPHADAKLSHMNRESFALFGLYVLLYLQNEQGYNSKMISSHLPGGGSRFLEALTKIVRQELGYDLPACKRVYDVVSRQLDATATRQKSDFSTKVDGATKNSKRQAIDISTYLKYLFSSFRKPDELQSFSQTQGVKLEGIVKCIIDYELLTQEILSYSNELHRLVMLEDIVTTQELVQKNIDDVDTKMTEVDRKRIKRLAELMNSIPYEHRLQLMEHQVIQLLMLRAQVLTYQQILQNRRSFVSKINFTNKEHKIEQKMAFLDACFQHIKLMYLANVQDTHTVQMPSLVIIDVFTRLYRVLVSDLDPSEFSDWVTRYIFNKDNQDTVNTLMWLTNEQLNYVFASTTTATVTAAAKVRNFVECTEGQFASVIAADSSDENQVQGYLSVHHASELIILLACQTAVLKFGDIIQAPDTSNRNIIAFASEHSWFLQLRFLEAILVYKNILPEARQGADATANLTKERGVLQVFDNMMKNIVSLPALIESCFQGARIDVENQISTMSAEENLILAFLVVLELTCVVFAVLAANTADSGEKSYLSKLFKHLSSIKKMIGYQLNGEYEAILFNIAVNLLSLAPALLEGTRLNVEENVRAVQEKPCSNSRQNITLMSSAWGVRFPLVNSEKYLTILSESKTLTFLKAVKQLNQSKNMTERVKTTAAISYVMNKK